MAGSPCCDTCAIAGLDPVAVRRPLPDLQVETLST
jgi:hypothetical protein